MAYRYRLYPTKAQTVILEKTLGVCRGVYNSLLHERTVLYETEGKSPSWLEQAKAITAWKKNHPELSTVFSQVLQNVVRRVDWAFRSFFRRVRNGEEPGYPRLKGQGQYDSITYPQYKNGFSFFQGKLRLSKIGDVNVRLHRALEGDIKTCTVRRTKTGKWFASFSCQVEAEYLEPSSEEVGIDVGLKVFVALSNGEFIENPRFFLQDQNALAKAQRRSDHVKRRHKTKERCKAKKAVARIHERIRCRRHDFVHKAARGLVDRFGTIAVEALQVEKMRARPAPNADPENPRQHLPNGAGAKAGLNKSIADASWSMFRNVLTMKAEHAGRRVVVVDPAYTSQTCSRCGNIKRKLLSERRHQCQCCGLAIDRDTNAAINIKSSIGKSAVGQYSLAASAA